MADNEDQFNRPFIRFQFPEWTEESFEWDEEDTLPAWVTEEHEESAKKVLLRISPAWAEYDKVRDQALAEYKKVRDQALAEYKKVRDQALAEYKKVHVQAWAEYEKVRDQAWAEYKKVRDQALAEFITALSTITGYVPA
jgi:ATP/maltotriose-dependent transcriptional regulator MalT